MQANLVFDEAKKIQRASLNRLYSADIQYGKVCLKTHKINHQWNENCVVFSQSENNIHNISGKQASKVFL